MNDTFPSGKPGERGRQSSAAGETRPGASLGAKRVLIADDDGDFRSLMEHLLRADGAEVSAVDSGAALLDRLTRGGCDTNDFDVVISDVRMPDLTAFEVLSRVPVASLPPVILVTAYGDRRTIDRGGDLGAEAVIRKPLDVGDLRAVVRAVLRQRGSRP